MLRYLIFLFDEQPVEGPPRVMCFESLYPSSLPWVLYRDGDGAGQTGDPHFYSLREAAVWYVNRCKCIRPISIQEFADRIVVWVVEDAIASPAETKP